MATFSVNITNGNSPVTVTSTNGTVSYETLQNSLGGYVYQLQDLYFQSQTTAQQMQPFLMKTFSEDGKALTTTAYTDFSLFQKIPVSQTDFKKGDIVFDGFTTMSFTVLPNENINMVLEVNQLAFSDKLAAKKRVSSEQKIDEFEVKETIVVNAPQQNKFLIDYKRVVALLVIVGIAYVMLKKD